MMNEFPQVIAQMDRPYLAYVMLMLLLVQGVAMLVDEFHFHLRRGLGAWERIGHPIDSLVFALALILLLHSGWTVVSVSVAILSALIVTKDEWVHRQEAPAAEQWLHSILFLLHALILWIAGEWGAEGALSAQQIAIIVTPIFLFIAYQILYWNFWRGRSTAARGAPSGLSPQEGQSSS